MLKAAKTVAAKRAATTAHSEGCLCGDNDGLWCSLPGCPHPKQPPIFLPSDPPHQPHVEGSEKDFHRAVNALLNTLWQKTYSGSRSHEENWQEMDRQFPQARWLHDELKAAKARALATEGQP